MKMHTVVTCYSVQATVRGSPSECILREWRQCHQEGGGEGGSWICSEEPTNSSETNSKRHTLSSE